MFTRRRQPPPTPTAPPEPVRDGATLIFRSRDHLVAWVRSLEEHPLMIRVVAPSHLGFLSTTFDIVASAPHGGVVLILPPTGVDVRPWLDEVRLEHGPDGLSDPARVRVGGEDGLLVSVVPTEPPTSWETWEPDAWPVPQAADAIFDARRVGPFMRSMTFARPVGLSEKEHDDATLLEFGARRWFRGRPVPTIAGLVAFAESTDRHLPGCAIAVRGPGGFEQVHKGSLPWVVDRVADERSIWGAVPTDIVRAVLTLALAKRAWAGPDAATPITLSMDHGLVRLAIPTRPANRREQEDRAPGNPRLRILLARSGLLPTVPGLDIADNDKILRQLDGRWAGVRNRYEDHVTWLEVPLQAGASVVPMMPSLAVLRSGWAVSPPRAQPPEPASQMPASPAESTERSGPSAAPVVAGEGPTQHAPTPASGMPSAVERSAPPGVSSRPADASASDGALPRPMPRRARAILHSNSASPLLTSAGRHAAAPSPEPAIAAPLLPTPDTTPSPVSPSPPPAVPTPSPPPTPSAGPLTLDERKAQLREIFLQADRPLAARELAETLSVHRDTLTPAIKALIAEGWLSPTDPNPRSPVQRYRRDGV